MRTVAGEHANVLAPMPPSTRPYIVDRHASDGWVEVGEFGSLQDAEAAEARLVEGGFAKAGEVRVRGERRRWWAGRVGLALLGALALVNLLLYGAMLTVE